MLNIFKCYLNIYKYLQRVLASPDMDVAAGRVVGSSEMGTVWLDTGHILFQGCGLWDYSI